MIKRFVEMRPVKFQLKIHDILLNLHIHQAIVDSFLKSPESDLEHLRLSEKDWEALIDFGLILKVRI